MPPLSEPQKSILVLCTANSARSQMAEGLLRHDHGGLFGIVESAGAKATAVRPEAIAAMAQIGIDISGHRSKSVAEFADRAFDVVITVCDNARESCPVYPGHMARRIHHAFDDPASLQGTETERVAEFARVRDEIRAWLAETFAAGA